MYLTLHLPIVRWRGYLGSESHAPTDSLLCRALYRPIRPETEFSASQEARRTPVGSPHSVSI